MKPINEWFDSEYNITNRVYRFENGVELLHSQNPATKDFVFSSVLHAGAAFESMMGVPDGTAHFLEHLFIEPNTRFKTKHMIDRFEYGDRSRPSLYVNAATSVKYLYLYGSCNEKGRDRLLERMDSILDYPDNWFEKYMRKERSVILAEHSHMYKREKDPDFQLVRFLIGKDLPHLTKRVIGEVDDIKQITPDDLRRFRSGLFLPKNTVFAVHSSGELSVKVRQDLERMADRFGNSDVEVFPPDEQLENRFDLRSFRDSREEGVSMSLNYFFEKTKTVDYPRRVLRA
ncbi:MAG: hypothetical protein PHG63_02685, partial [Candidatus Dojkabacteria bacterium]|nr:hypothetical protein [Candidatus Dojkabacteria bacterium]